ncbi:hypothetical protein L6452_42483 [Arctium lappa]|uniref:Uncharacterized protein n=1 Tax=Arctium lappa TaxID=4217 RepID=A0ACB8XMG6_ARCLA|nr:hypothetical protein L6452_42483 [Arctium lappa]
MPVTISHKKFIAYAMQKCGIEGSAVWKLVFRNDDGSMVELTNDREICGFMQFAAQSEIPPTLFVYAAPLMCDEGDDEDDDGGDDEETQPEEEKEEEEEEHQEIRFAGVADDRNHVFTMGISDMDRSDTDNDEDEEVETYTLAINHLYGIIIGYHQGWRARCRALLIVRGTPEESYERLPTYLYNLELQNPGTRTRIRTDSKERFEMCFAALGCAMKRNLLTSMAEKIILRRAGKSMTWRVSGIGYDKFQVWDTHHHETVDMVNHVCSCLQWKYFGLPYDHAIVAARCMGHRDGSDLAISVSTRPPSAMLSTVNNQETYRETKKAIEKSETEIEQLTEEWKEMIAKKDGHLKRIDEEEKAIKRLKREIKDKESRIRRENLEVHKIVKDFAVLQAKVTEKQNWIDQCKALYP